MRQSKLVVRLDEFDTWGDFVAASVEGKSSSSAAERSSRSKGHWSGTKTWAEAVSLATGGWAEGYDRMTRIAARLTRDITRDIEQPSVEFAVTGSYVDVGSFLSGEPECMGTFVYAPVEQPVVQIVANVRVNAAVGHDVIETRGLATLALIDALERAGRRCEVIAISAGTGWGKLGDGPHVERIVLKRPQEQANPGLLAFALSHPAMLRRLLFSFEETLPAKVREHFGYGGPFGGGYNAPCEVPKDMRGDVYVTCADFKDGRWRGKDTAEAWVREQLAKQGVIVATD